ncbi:ABC transporter ATP-binding protein/permease [Pararhodobacter sp. CCB-MM2]|uniref:ABC transporter ATP-binding protein/permease n=1 Tax=Pararhodobacter sp. CCB-MM2 TaxID=1786003 RepID=UPI0009F5D137|nr:ATP-binding cassette domain-containing protein [Pararhodobacter sp. CCB-MM2]
MARKDAPLMFLLAPARRSLALGAALSLAGAALWIVQAWVIARALADLLAGGGTPGRAALIFLGLACVRVVLSYLAEGRLFAASDAVVSAQRLRILTREAKAPALGPGAAAALAIDKLEALHPYVTRYYPAMARVAVMPAVILSLAFWHSWAVGLVLLVAGPVIPVFMMLIGWAAQDASRRHMAEVGAMGDLMVDRLAALADMRLLDAGGLVTQGFSRAAEDLRSRTMAVLRVAFLSSTVLELFAALGVAMVAVWTGFSVLQVVSWGAWGGPIAPVIGIWLLLLAPEFFQPLRALAAAWHDRAAAAAVAEELARWEAGAGAPILGAGGKAEALSGPVQMQWQGLSARGVAFPDGAVHAGERVALTGPSGAGKSTLLRLLAGLEAPEAGTITVAGVPLDEAYADAWRARLGWMPQTPHFPEVPLSNFLTDGTPDPALLRLAALDGVIARLPEGLASIPGETGAGLSGGEARRVLLAKMLHARPDLVLADEPTADLDAETAEAVIHALLTLTEGGATLIIATHDPRLIARLDREVAL